jgi:trehalose-phosphatase
LGAIPNLTLGAEHPALMRSPETPTWHALASTTAEAAWKPSVPALLEQFADRAPGSFVYRRVEPEFGTWLAGELTALLDGLLAETDARPVMGRKIVEVRPVWANKGAFDAQLVPSCDGTDFQLAAGDDTTDEDLFEMPDPGPSLSE